MTYSANPQSFWVVPDRFVAANYPGDKTEALARAKLAPILASGVDVFIDLTHPYEPTWHGRLERYDHLLPEHVRHERRAIPDMKIPRDPRDMTAILDLIDEELANGSFIYLHCWGGHGRTGTVVGCWLRRHGRTANEALSELHEMWQQSAKAKKEPEIPQTSDQFAYIRNWEEQTEEE